MNSKKVYIYSGLAILGALGVYGYVSFKKRQEILKAQKEVLDEVQSGEEETIVTPTGSEITVDQATVPKNLDEILKNTPQVASKLLLNKTMFTKVPNVNVRLENFVNNGFINNSFGKIATSDVNVGKVIAVVEDKGKMKNPQGRVYKWFKIKPSQASIDAINKNKDFLQANRMLTSNLVLYYREDTLKL
jgi:protoporphyrinogen oxidase